MLALLSKPWSSPTAAKAEVAKAREFADTSSEVDALRSKLQAAEDALARAKAEAEDGRRAAAEAVQGQMAALQRASAAEAVAQATREEVTRLSQGTLADSAKRDDAAATSRAELLAEITRLQRSLEEARSSEAGSKLTVEKLRMELAAAEGAAARVSADLKRAQEAADRQADLAQAQQEKLAAEIAQLRAALDAARSSDAASKIMARRCGFFPLCVMMHVSAAACPSSSQSSD